MWKLFIKGRGNYLESEAGSRDTLWDTLSDSWKEDILPWLEEVLTDVLILMDNLSFWITCLGSIFCIWLYAATHDKKYTKKITVLFLGYIFFKMIVGELLK